jgi:hypothetical protein
VFDRSFSLAGDSTISTPKSSPVKGKLKRPALPPTHSQLRIPERLTRLSD